MPTCTFRNVALMLATWTVVACHEKTTGDAEKTSAYESSVLQCFPPEPSSGVVTIHPSDPHRLAIQGETWYPVGWYNGSVTWADAAYGSGLSAVYAANHDLIDQLAAHDLNFYRTWLTYNLVGDSPDGTGLYPYVRSGPGTAVDGSPKLDLDTFNQEHFDAIADAVDYANANGIVAQLILIHCGAIEYGGGAYSYLNFFAADNNIQGLGFANADEYYATSGPIWDRHLAYVQKVVQTVGNRPNIMWEVCNEKSHGFSSPPTFAETQSDPFFNAIVSEIRALGSPHLVVGTDLPQHSTVAGHLVPQSDPDIASFHAAASQQWGWDVPLISDNDCCPGEADASLARQKAWAALTAGAQVDIFSEASALWSFLHGSNTQNGMRYLSYVRAFLRDQCIELAGMYPDDSLVQSGNGWAITRSGEEIIAYRTSWGAVTLGGLPSSYDATWFDPTSGGSVPAGAGPTFAEPGSNAEGGSDWVLFVRANGGPSLTTHCYDDTSNWTEVSCNDGCGCISCWTEDGTTWTEIACPSSCTASCGTASCPFSGALVGLGDKVVDVEWGSAENGSIVQIYSPHGGANQQWQLMPDGTLQVSYGKCLTALWGDTQHSPVGIWDCYGGDDQLWWMDSIGSLHLGSRCLDIPWSDATDGNDLQLFDCHGGDNQRWAPCP